MLVNLNTEDTWGKSEHWPSIIHFSKSGEKPFMVRVFARRRESTKNYGTVTVTGRWEMPEQDLSGSVYPPQGAQGRINIAQFHRFTLMSPKAFTRINPGENVIFQLNIQNRGNGLDEFYIRIKNLEELKDKDFDLTLNRQGVVIEEHPQEATIKLLVETPSSMKWLGYHQIEVEVESIKGSVIGQSAQTFTFVIDIPDKYLFYTAEFPGIALMILLIIIITILWIKFINDKKRRFNYEKYRKVNNDKKQK